MADERRRNRLIWRARRRLFPSLSRDGGPRRWRRSCSRWPRTALPASARRGPAQRTPPDGMAPPQAGHALATPAAVWAIRHKARASCASTMAASWPLCLRRAPPRRRPLAQLRPRAGPAAPCVPYQRGPRRMAKKSRPARGGFRGR